MTKSTSITRKLKILARRYADACVELSWAGRRENPREARQEGRKRVAAARKALFAAIESLAAQGLPR